MSEELSEPNRNIVGHIEVVAAFGADGEATADAGDADAGDADADVQSTGIEERRP